MTALLGRPFTRGDKCVLRKPHIVFSGHIERLMRAAPLVGADPRREDGAALGLQAVPDRTWSSTTSPGSPPVTDVHSSTAMDGEGERSALALREVREIFDSKKPGEEQLRSET
ncbi:hypothetical protein GCM10010289_58760 [Streptomyces violascens]|nr:hypothetical protein GCM10010289_58760 [Streptomyces violascens]